MKVSEQDCEIFAMADLICAGAMFHLNCFNSGDRNHLSAGLIDGQLLIPGKLLQSLVFDPVVSQVRFHTDRLPHSTHQTTGPIIDRGTNEKYGSAN